VKVLEHDGAEFASAHPIEVRKMASKDVAEVSRLEARCFSTPWSPGTFRNLLHRDGAELWVAAEDRREGLLGYYVLWCVEDQAELANIAVDETYRGRGVGSLLLDHALVLAKSRGAESMYLEVRVSNATAAAMYEARGFEQIGVRRDYYDRPREDARVLMKRLVKEEP
jgi:[ribosomal protein S18]-alanine N-acetyltransferase